MTDVLGDECAIEYLKAGAEDCMRRGELAWLCPAVRAAVAVRRPLRRLTPQQHEVLKCIARGDSTAGGAQRLAISPRPARSIAPS